jgi:hypothetical protein
MERNMKSSPNTQKQKPKQAGYRIDPWCEEFGGVSRAQVFEWIREGKLPSVKVGGMRVITQSPEDFLAKHAAKPAA